MRAFFKIINILTAAFPPMQSKYKPRMEVQKSSCKMMISATGINTIKLFIKPLS